jgi:uncharacterized alpha-E superfamily protein
MVYDGEGTSPLSRHMEQVRSVAWLLRDRISGDAWRVLSRLGEQLSALAPAAPLLVSTALDRLNEVVLALSAFSGLVMEGMTRGDGWRFLDIGRRLERSVNVGRLLRVSLELGSSHHVMLGPLLEIADSAMTYRRRYFAQPQLAPILDLLLADETNARALAFQLVLLADHVNELPRDQRAPSPTREQRIIARARDALAGADLDALAQPDDDGRQGRLLALLQSLDDDLRALSDAITHFYFSHAELRIS